MPVFVRQVQIAAPVETVFAFHERPDALDLLSPAFPPVRVVSRTGGLATGARVELRIAGVIRWVAVHTAFERNRLFVDEQAEGPFAEWVHRHEFEAVDGGTRLTDRVTYRLRGGRAANAIAPVLVAPGLSRMFGYRHRVTRRWCETDA